MRSVLTLVHRYAGLGIAMFLAIVGLTGSLLAWNDELERIFAPALFVLPPAALGAPSLDPFTLRERVAAAYPNATVDGIDFMREPDAPARFFLSEKPGMPPLENDEIAVDPATGAVLGERRSADIAQGAKNLMPFVYSLHDSLAMGAFGRTLLGIVAVVWTVDCFIGAYLTFPVRAAGHRWPLSWLARWRAAWAVRWPTTPWKLSFDLHRAGGLWPWALLLVLAWSSVAFNLPQIYEPVTKALLNYDRASDTIEQRPATGRNAKLDWREGYRAARTAMDEAATREGFAVRSERLLFYDDARHAYVYRVKSDRDPGRLGNTQVYIDADTGVLLGIDIPTGHIAGVTVTTWIGELHTASIFGMTMQVVICLTGLAIALLSITGVLIYLRKRRAREIRRRKPAAV
jgi:uncharacterized iron-regulated membrane protein